MGRKCISVRLEGMQFSRAAIMSSSPVEYATTVDSLRSMSEALVNESMKNDMAIGAIKYARK